MRLSDLCYIIRTNKIFFQNSKAESVDAKVIDGHVIPKHVLFTAPTPRDHPYQTLAEVDNFKVKIHFSQSSNSKLKTSNFFINI